MRSWRLLGLVREVRWLFERTERTKSMAEKEMFWMKQSCMDKSQLDISSHILVGDCNSAEEQTLYPAISANC